MATLIAGNDGANTLTGTVGDDVIYGYDPNGSQATSTSITAERVASGLTQPLFAGAPKGDPSRLFIVEKAGVIKILDLQSGQVLATPFLDIADEVDDVGERGLLGLAFDPDFADNGFFYVYLINNAGNTEVRRYEVSANPNVADEASEQLILTVNQPAGLSNHKAGWIGFGPDGYLYIATGDGGGGGDPFNNGQNINTLLGKILRIDVNGDDFPADPNRNYAIPDDNPFVGEAGADEIFAYGLRNPFRNSFDRALGTFFIADVGQGTWEEIDLGQLGANYGWDSFEGPNPFPGGSPLNGTPTPPIHFYGRDVGATVIGGYVYRGSAEGLQGQLFFADFIAGTVSTLRQVGSQWIATDLTSKIVTTAGAINLPTSFGEDGFGNLYIVDIADGEVYRLTPNTVSADLGDTLDGGAGDDMLFGGSGNDTLIGGEGTDLLNGGPGIDTADYAASSQGVTVNLLTGVGSGGDAEGDLLQSIENVIGSAHDDTLTGNSGNNHLRGGGGNDTIDGGGGNDTADYSDKTASVVVTLNGAMNATVTVGGVAEDTIRNIENVIGGGGNDTLTSDSGNNHLRGGGGNDTIDGGSANDTADYSDKTASVIVTLNGATNATVTVGGIAEDTVRNIENVIGGSGNDTLTGDDASNRLEGGSGNDILDGGAGADTLIGGIGNDTFRIRGSEGVGDTFVGGPDTDRIQVQGTSAAVLGGFNTVTSSIEIWEGNGQALLGTAAAEVFDFSALVAVSGLPAVDSGAGNDWMVGSGFNDFFVGGSGNDVLVGGNGDDILVGADGDDLLLGDAGNDYLDGGSGNDYLGGGAGNDILVGADGNDVLSGDLDHDYLVGGAGNDSLFGGAGNDTLDGGLGNDHLVGDAGGDVLYGGFGDDYLVGGEGDDVLYGVDGNDRLEAGNGNDYLEGGPGNDFLIGGVGKEVFYGGPGADRFDFNTIGDSRKGNSRDRIEDFSRKQGDRIDLRDIDANSKKGGNQKFKFIGDDKFSKTAGELRYDNHKVQGDVNGDGKADFEIRVSISVLKSSDFIL